jgi:hypothetical protein
VGDFNGDAVPDVAVANALSNGVSVLLGNGDGTFQGPRNFESGASPFVVAVGDFNGDGRQDLVVSNGTFAPDRLNGFVSVLLGNGDGTFQAALTIPPGVSPGDLVVSDFNGDGMQDLAVSNGVDLSVLMGNGDGTFRLPRNFAGAGSSVAVGDFDGDGRQDLALATSFQRSGSVSLLLGDGDGGFRDPRSYWTGTMPLCVAVGDFNGDGVEDLVVADRGSIEGIGSGLSVLLGIGDGTFQAEHRMGAGSFPLSVAVGDFDGDGRLDAAVANGLIPGTVSLLLGNGDGTFRGIPRAFEVCDFPNSVAVGDFNGDGLLDVAVACQGRIRPPVRPGGVSVLLGNGDGTFQVAGVELGGSANFVAVSDFNGDGVPDLAVTYSSPPDQVRVFLGNGDGTFQAPRSFAIGNYPHYPQSISVSDFNRDGAMDLAVANDVSNDVSVLLGNGDGTFQAVRHFDAGGPAGSSTVGDFNGDGVQDIAITGTWGMVSILLGNGDGSFQAPRRFSASNGSAFVVAGDFNRDGQPDLVTANVWGISQYSRTISVLINDTRP